MASSEVSEDELQGYLDKILAEFKITIVEILNETADEFDERELTEELRYIYNEFTAKFGQKVLNLGVKAE